MLKDWKYTPIWIKFSFEPVSLAKIALDAFISWRRNVVLASSWKNWKIKVIYIYRESSKRVRDTHSIYVLNTYFVFRWRPNWWRYFRLVTSFITVYSTLAFSISFINLFENICDTFFVFFCNVKSWIKINYYDVSNILKKNF